MGKQKDMNKSYDHKKIERKWQREWIRTKLYKTSEDKKKPKFYVLDMFPYPSGEGLHVGHPRGYIGTDIFSRFKKMSGFNVLHPMGWDAFGLPAEQYAIKNKIHPEIAVKKNIKRYKEQLSVIGFNYDWEREINTTDPEYYRWTQWTFLQMLKKGLAYESFEPINWCPSCQTGLANEDLENGVCERCGSEVEKKPMRQWVLRITDYADRMLKDLDILNWPESIKESQRKWIGRSEGAEITFAIQSDIKRFVLLHGYTGTPENNFFPWLKAELEKHGYEVIVPALPNTKNPTVAEQVSFVLENIKFDAHTALLGHSLGGTIALKIAEQKPLAKLILADAVTNSIRQDRQTKYEKTFNWIFDWNRIRSHAKEIIFLSDITPGNDVLPSHAENAAKELSAEVRKIHANDIHICAKEEPEVLKAAIDSIKVFTTRADTLFGVTYVVLAPEHQLVRSLKERISNLNEAEKYIEATTYRSEIERMAEKKDKTGVELKGIKAINPANGEEVSVWIADYVLANYGTGAVMAVPAHDERDFEFAQNFKLPIKMVVCPKYPAPECPILDEAYVGEGHLVASGKFDGMKNDEAKKEITKEFGRSKVTYKLKDWVFSRQRYWGEPIPVIHCLACGVVPVPEKDLPVILPKVKSYEPAGTGESPLATIDKWVNVKCPKCKGPAKRETNTMPQWAGSSWYYLRYIDPKNKKALVDKKKEKYWSPVDMYVGGTEHATRHLIYARFWHKFLYDIKVVNHLEPFTRLQNQGLIMASDGRKMSKRWGNVINPDDIVKTYGADTLRLYEMFMGPFDQSIAWNTDSIMGARRFIEKVWRLQYKTVKKTKVKNIEIEKLLHKTIKKVTEDIETMSFNTAISSMMILVNEMEKSEGISFTDFKMFIQILAPFAPHITEDIWIASGEKKSVHVSDWPKFDKKKIVDDTFMLVVQVNGKVRAQLVAPIGANEEIAKKIAFADTIIQGWIAGKEVKKFVYVPNKLVNIVI